MNLPNFLICGVQKGGTSTLYNTLKQHPEVCMSQMKEIHYFDRDEKYSRGIEWYKKHFEGCASATAVGEATPHYYRHQVVLERVKETLGEVKLIFILRDPVQRAYSNYWFNISRGIEKREFKEAIKTEDGKERYLSKGYYDKYLRWWFESFQRDNLLVLLLRDLKENWESTMYRLCEFLNIESNLSLFSSTHSNPTRTPKDRIRKYGVFILSSLVRWGQILPKSLRKKLKPFKENLKDSMTDKGYPPLDQEVREELIKLYEDHILRLENLLNRDLGHWKEV